MHAARILASMLARLWKSIVLSGLAFLAGLGLHHTTIADDEATDGVPRLPDGYRLVERAFENLYGDDYIQTLLLSTRGEGEREMSRRLQITRKQSVRPGRALVRFLSPYKVRGTSILIEENDDSSDDLYVYLPAARLTRHLSTAQRGDSFFGTDLTYEDIEPKSVSDYEVRSDSWDHTSGAPCVRVQLRPASGFESNYEAMVSCIEEARGVIVWTEFYQRGVVVKSLNVDLGEVQAVGSRYVPFLMKVRNLQRRTETVVLTESYELRPSIPERLFSMWNLEVGDAERDRSRSHSTR